MPKKRVDNDKIPFGVRYYAMAWADYLLPPRWIPGIAALCPDTDFDRHESALWLNNLLHRIHREVH